jgi:hypothetical protein
VLPLLDVEAVQGRGKDQTQSDVLEHYL